jgi:cyclopropane fatty-acyl-phospholipid synthase-like methyltransferase
MANVWDNWNLGGGPNYPHNKLIQYLLRRYAKKEDRKHITVLDLGCGSGVNSIFMAAESFSVSACDISRVGVENTRKRFKEASLYADIKQCGIDKIDYPDSSFDEVISIGVLDCVGPDLFSDSLKEIIRVLKSNGSAFLLFASERDFRCSADLPFFFNGYSHEQVNSLLEPVRFYFQDIYIDFYVTTFENASCVSDDFIVTLKRKK